MLRLQPCPPQVRPLDEWKGEEDDAGLRAGGGGAGRTKEAAMEAAKEAAREAREGRVRVRIRLGLGLGLGLGQGGGAGGARPG